MVLLSLVLMGMLFVFSLQIEVDVAFDQFISHPAEGDYSNVLPPLFLYVYHYTLSPFVSLCLYHLRLLPPFVLSVY